MSLGRWVKEQAARVAINRAAKEWPMLKRVGELILKVLTWGPPGGKRSAAALVGMVNVVLRHFDAMFKELCQAGWDVVCGWQLAAFAAHADAARVWIEGISATADVATLVLGIVGFAGAFARKKQ